MFGGKYSRLKFWIISICLLFITSFINGMGGIFEGVADNGAQNISLGLYILVTIFSLIWINTLANRIRDFGSNPWIALFGIIPVVNIILALYYGIANKLNAKNSGNFILNADYTHNKDTSGGILNSNIKQSKQSELENQNKKVKKESNIIWPESASYHKKLALAIIGIYILIALSDLF